MGTAPFFERTKIAAAQVLAGFDADAFTAALEQTSVGISIGADSAATLHGQAGTDLLVRLCARLYPNLAVFAPDTTADGRPDTPLRTRLIELARTINPNITITPTATTIVHVGADAVPDTATPDTGTPAEIVYLGCDDWTGRLSTSHPLPVETGDIPIGAGVAACLGAAALFRLLLDPTSQPPGDCELTSIPATPPHAATHHLPDRSALAGGGAIGEATLWALALSPVTGTLHLVEPENTDLGNLQRYVLTDMTSVDQPKTQIAIDHVRETRRDLSLPDFAVVPHQQAWADATDTAGTSWDLIAVAVDSAEARRQVQASLPHHLVNAWTQTGDLGVSIHDFLNGACCACLYLPTGTTRNEDEIYATALGVPERQADIRALLYSGQPVPNDLLDLIANRLALDPTAVETFRGTPVRDLYVRGICGGGLVPLAHNPGGGALHVPLAHQSTLAGVLQAARILEQSTGGDRRGTEVTRVDIRRDPPDQPHQSAAKDPRGICVCQDDMYTAAYKSLWGEPEGSGT